MAKLSRVTCMIGVCIGVAGCFVSSRSDPAPVRDPWRDVYDHCASDSECFASDCWDITVDYPDVSVTDAMCTNECRSDLDCDLDGYCLQVSNEPPLCYAPCFGDEDCPFGFACIADEFGFDPVCLPW